MIVFTLISITSASCKLPAQLGCLQSPCVTSPLSQLSPIHTHTPCSLILSCLHGPIGQWQMLLLGAAIPYPTTPDHGREEQQQKPLFAYSESLAQPPT